MSPARSGAAQALIEQLSRCYEQAHLSDADNDVVEVEPPLPRGFAVPQHLVARGATGVATWPPLRW